MVERVIRTIKEQCVHRHRFESQQHATRVVGDWIQFYNHRRPHQALGMKTPAEAYALAAWPVQKTLGHYMTAEPFPSRTRPVSDYNRRVTLRQARRADSILPPSERSSRAWMRWSVMVASSPSDGSRRLVPRRPAAGDGPSRLARARSTRG